MKHLQKSLKDIKILISIIFFVFILFSCTSEKNYGTIYYFEQHELHTIIPLSCSDIFEHSGLRKISIEDKKIYELLKNSKEEIDFDKKYDPDVRYKIEIGSDVFCIEYSGHFILNNEHRGKLNFINKIEKFISKNKNQSIKVTEPTSKPWGSN
jgi:hypothetical protein